MPRTHGGCRHQHGRRNHRCVGDGGRAHPPAGGVSREHQVSTSRIPATISRFVNDARELRLALIGLGSALGDENIARYATALAEQAHRLGR